MRIYGNRPALWSAVVSPGAHIVHTAPVTFIYMQQFFSDWAVWRIRETARGTDTFARCFT